jgi:rhodanese-related sulfurtransferase
MTDRSKQLPTTFARAATAAVALALTLVLSSCSSGPTDEEAPPKATPEQVPERYRGSAVQRRQQLEAEAKAKDDVVRVSPTSLAAEIEQGAPVVILNIHSPVDAPRVKGSVDVALAELEAWAAKRDKAAAIVTYCTCPRDTQAVQAVHRLRALGFTNLRVLEGGLETWEGAGLPTVSPR